MPTTTSWLVVIDGNSLFADTFEKYVAGTLPYGGVANPWFKCSAFEPGTPFCSLTFSPDSRADLPPEERPLSYPKNYVPYQAVLLVTESVPEEQPFGFRSGAQD